MEGNPGMWTQMSDWMAQPQNNAMLMGLGGGLMQYGQPSTEQHTGAGAMASGVNGMLAGMMAQKQAEREEKYNGMLEKILQAQMAQIEPPAAPVQSGMAPASPAPVGPQGPISSAIGMPPPQGAAPPAMGMPQSLGGMSQYGMLADLMRARNQGVATGGLGGLPAIY